MSSQIALSSHHSSLWSGTAERAILQLCPSFSFSLDGHPPTDRSAEESTLFHYRSQFICSFPDFRSVFFIRSLCQHLERLSTIQRHCAALSTGQVRSGSELSAQILQLENRSGNFTSAQGSWTCRKSAFACRKNL